MVETASHLGQWLCGGGTTTNDTVDPIALYRTRDEAFDALYCDTVEGPFQVARALPNRDALGPIEANTRGLKPWRRLESRTDYVVVCPATTSRQIDQMGLFWCKSSGRTPRTPSN